jgi:hypothetical protein
LVAAVSFPFSNLTIMMPQDPWPSHPLRVVERRLIIIQIRAVEVCIAGRIGLLYDNDRGEVSAADAPSFQPGQPVDASLVQKRRDL